MSNINKQALREAAEGVLQRYGSEWFETGSQVCTVHKSKITLISTTNPATVLALLDELGAKDRRIEEEIGRANREHHRGFMMACGHLKQHSNVHYADAAEMEIAALRERIAELTEFISRVKKCLERNGEYAPLSHEEIDTLLGIRAAGISIKGE